MAIRKDVDPNTPVYIYVLIDPRSELVRYVGWTQDINKRLIGHMSEARTNSKNHKSNWIRSLISEGFSPIIKQIEEIKYSQRIEKEQYWIKHYGRENLTNGTDGGEGTLGLIVSEENRRRQSEMIKSNPDWGKWNKGKKITDPEILNRLSESHMGQVAWNKGKSTPYILQWLTPFKKGHIPHNKGIPTSEEIKKKQSEAKLGIRIGKKRKDTSSKLVGVVYNVEDDVWISQIRYNGTNHFIGRFKKESFAGMAYDLHSIFSISPNCNLNFPELREKYISYLKQYEILDIKQLRKAIKNFINEEGSNLDGKK